MIIDCHTHLWENSRQLGRGGAECLRRMGDGAVFSADPGSHLAAAQCVDRSWVLGFRSRHLDGEVPNSLLARFVRSYPDKLLGAAGVDPCADDAYDQLAQVAYEPAFSGVAINPAAQDFHPADSRAGRMYEFCAQHGLVVFVHGGTHLPAGAKLEYARPYLWDEVLRDHVTLRVVLCDLGHPWPLETIALLAKHANVYAELGGLTRRPWQAYNALCQAYDFGVMDKLLFGSDFPFFTAGEAIESLYRLNELAHGTHLPHVPREQIRGIIERDAMAALGVSARPKV
jgi:hypothetical protein